MHFISGISEEGMAGFTGALDVAGVSIELRMDSTLREALDVQSILKDFLETINRDYLRLMTKDFPTKDLSKWSELGTTSIDSFTIVDLGGMLTNQVSFAPVTPRSQIQERQAILGMYNNKTISLETALEMLGIEDPLGEMTKREKEEARKSLLIQAMQEGIKTENDILSPEEEVQWVLENNQMPANNLAQTVNADQLPYLEAIDNQLKKMGQSPNLWLMALKEERTKLMQNQTGLQDMKQRANPQQVQAGAQQQLIPGKPPAQQQNQYAQQQPQQQGQQQF